MCINLFSLQTEKKEEEKCHVVEVCVFPFICMNVRERVWKRTKEKKQQKSFGLHWVYVVQWQNVRLALLFPLLTLQQPQREEKTALNQTEQLHPKWQVPLIKDPALLPPRLLTHPLSVVKVCVNTFGGKTNQNPVSELIFFLSYFCFYSLEQRWPPPNSRLTVLAS